MCLFERLVIFVYQYSCGIQYPIGLAEVSSDYDKHSMLLRFAVNEVL